MEKQQNSRQHRENFINRTLTDIPSKIIFSGSDTRTRYLNSSCQKAISQFFELLVVSTDLGGRTLSSKLRVLSHRRFALSQAKRKSPAKSPSSWLRGSRFAVDFSSPMVNLLHLLACIIVTKTPASAETGTFLSAFPICTSLRERHIWMVPIAPATWESPQLSFSRSSGSKL